MSAVYWSPSAVLQDFLKAGYVVQVVSKLCGKSLRVLENGIVDCGGDAGTACEHQTYLLCMYIIRVQKI